MKIIGLIDEDFVNYKEPCMVIEFPYCNFKCDKECGMQVCQNSTLATAKPIDISANKLVQRYINNPITKAICCQGLEPFDSWEDLLKCIASFREKTDDDIIIYTGYTEEEIAVQIAFLKNLYSNIIIKFGRFIPNQEGHFDEVLGVNLASDNQYAKVFH